jgi:hypothetical protein
MKILILILAFSTTVFSSEVCFIEDLPEIKNLYSRVLELRPDIDETWALRFAYLLQIYTSRYDLDPYRAIAIAMQESSLREVHRKTTVIKYQKTCEKNSTECKNVAIISEKYSDFGIFQFHVRTIDAYGYDLEKLKNHDLEYAVMRYCQLMQEKLRICRNLGETAWTCYHSTTPKLRKNYEKLVNRYYKEVN